MIVQDREIKLATGHVESGKMKLKNILSEIEVLGQTKVIPLSKIPADMAKIAVSSGRKDNDQVDDVVMSKKASLPVKDLKPAQTEIIKEKAFGMAIKFLSRGEWDGVDLEAIISSDNYIMDGHHRWAAISLIDPKAKIAGTVINLPGVSLVSVLNIVTKALGKSGNPGSGDIATFKGNEFEPIIADAIANGIKGQYPIPAEDIKAALGKVPGANGDPEKAKEIMMRNADLLPKQIMPGAPDRVDMPVIGPEEVQKIANVIKNGVVDFTKPYSPNTKLQETMNELKLSSYGVKDILKAIFNRIDLLPKLGFRKFKDVIYYLKDGDQEEQSALEDKLKQLGVNVVYESKETQLRKLVREEVAKVIKSRNQTK